MLVMKLPLVPARGSRGDESTTEEGERRKRRARQGTRRIRDRREQEEVDGSEEQALRVGRLTRLASVRLQRACVAAVIANKFMKTVLQWFVKMLPPTRPRLVYLREINGALLASSVTVKHARLVSIPQRCTSRAQKCLGLEPIAPAEPLRKSVPLLVPPHSAEAMRTCVLIKTAVLRPSAPEYQPVDAYQKLMHFLAGPLDIRRTLCHRDDAQLVHSSNTYHRHVVRPVWVPAIYASKTDVQHLNLPEPVFKFRAVLMRSTVNITSGT
ncbi:hypothetical protein BC629DRAFT_1436306 [Irpex lacteus]|nr:hypothetical protein BC629DRAFT_1436306 [Irpex lacteus]